MSTDLRSQLAEYGRHIGAEQRPVDLDEVAALMEKVRQLPTRTAAAPTASRKRGWWIAAAALAATLLLVGGIAWLSRPGDQPIPPAESSASTTVAPSTTASTAVESITETTVASPTTTLPGPGEALASLGEVVAVVDTALGAVTWRQASSIPLDLVQGDQSPDPGHRWAHRWLALYENAQDATGACFDIFEESSGYLGLGPCAADWQPQHSWYVKVGGGPRTWEPDDRKWLWMNEVWFSPDGELWDQTTEAFPDSTAVVAAEPWSVAERDGQWVVIGATGVSRDADIPLEDRTAVERRVAEITFNPGGLNVSRSAEPAAWVSDNLPFGWKRVFVDFDEEGTDTRLTSVVVGEAGWVIFGIRASQAIPQSVQWVGWASTDGLSWEELPMADVLDASCEPTRFEHCGLIKAHMLDDAIVAYAWTWPPTAEHTVTAWELLIGTLGGPD